MNLKLFYLGSGIMAFIGTFFALAKAGGLYVHVSHVGSFTYLLYVLPLILVGVAVLSIYKPDVKHLKIWFCALGVAGFILSSLSLFYGMSYMKGAAAMGQHMQSREQGFDKGFQMRSLSMELDRARFDANFRMNNKETQDAARKRIGEIEREIADLKNVPVAKPEPVSVIPGVGSIINVLAYLAVFALAIYDIKKHLPQIIRHKTAWPI